MSMNKRKYANGGRIQTTKIDKPRMTPSSVIKESMDRDVMYESPKESEEEHKATMDQKFAEAAQKKATGGEIEKATEIIPDRGYGKITIIDKAEGGEVRNPKHSSITEAIMNKRKYANGGIAEDSVEQHEDDASLPEGAVDIDDNEREMPNSYYERNEDAALKENYDEDIMKMSQPMDSNEHSRSITSDEYDMIDMIRRKMKSKQTP